MRKINYRGVDATGMDRKTFEERLRECEREAKSADTNYLRGFVNGYESSLGIFGRTLRRIFPNYENLEVMVFRNELVERRRREIDAYGNS